ncbi:MAG: TonB family protein [Candidatus Omnitrophota bacterium]|nr:TonB family protein [Candidatus Omnitrophota bacterium]
MQLFKDRILNTAILISLIWHVAIMVSFTPVIKTGHIKSYDTSIAFIGDILERIVPGNEKVFTLEQVSSIARTDKLDSIDSKKLVPPQSYPISDFIGLEPEKEQLSYSSDERRPLGLKIYFRKESARIQFSNFFMKGEARDRIIIYKPDLNKVFVLSSDFSSDFNVSVKFIVSKHGFVKAAECVTSSGFTEIDQAALRYVRKWQFVPAADDGQEGVVRVSFKQ